MNRETERGHGGPRGLAALRAGGAHHGVGDATVNSRFSGTYESGDAAPLSRLGGHSKLLATVKLVTLAVSVLMLKNVVRLKQ